uniref:Uncharacterized protein n=1 Tax=Panagrolaimus sp. JU765 TaxID=591449 RepID=A0AC34QP46_9BILA
MDQNVKNFEANMAVLENFKQDPIYKGYWENWSRAQKWMQNCEQTFHDFQWNVESPVEMEVDEAYVKFNNTTFLSYPILSYPILST